MRFLLQTQKSFSFNTPVFNRNLVLSLQVSLVATKSKTDTGMDLLNNVMETGIFKTLGSQLYFSTYLVDVL